jgi:site-specific recombinase XerD
MTCCSLGCSTSIRFSAALDVKRSAELRNAGLKDGEEIRFIVHRMHDGQPLAGKIRSAWEGILLDTGLDEDVVRHTARHTAATWLMQLGTDLLEAAGWLVSTLDQQYPDRLLG